MKKILLTQGKFALVDNKDFEWLSQYKWFFIPYSNGGYAKRMIRNNGKGIWLSMHRIILGLKSREIGDHINGNTLDNRRNNLRKCTPSGNSRNKSIGKNNKTGYKGVYWNKFRNIYQAYITVNWHNKYLGKSNDKIETAKIYNQAAKKYFGEFARLNNI